MKKIILAAVLTGMAAASSAQQADSMPGVYVRQEAIHECADRAPGAEGILERVSFGKGRQVTWSPVWDRVDKKFVPLGKIKTDDALEARLIEVQMSVVQALQAASRDPALTKMGWPLFVEHAGKHLNLAGLPTTKSIQIDPRDPVIKDFLIKLELVNQITVGHLRGESCTPASFNQMLSLARAKVERQSTCTGANIKLLATAAPTQIDCDLDSFQIVLGEEGGVL